MAGKIIADIIEAPYDSIRMNVANVTVLTANSSGLTYVPTGNVNINIGGTSANLTMNLLTANGIKFPATAVASADGNTLDDYEEGTWTPDLRFGGNNISLTYDAGRGGRYTKIGRIVTVSFYLKLTNKGSSTGNATIDTLPFVPYNAGGVYPFYVGVLVGESGMSSMPTGTYCLGWSDSRLYLRVNGTSSFTNLSETNFTNSGAIYATITYEIA